jgi:hypothetical protein
MSKYSSRFSRITTLFAAAALLLFPVGLMAQASQPAADKSGSANAGTAQSATSSSTAAQDRWLHVRVESMTSKGDTVRVNVPLEFAEKVLPTIHRDRLYDGKIRLSGEECNGVDMRALLEAVRSSKDGEFVSVQGHDGDVRVAKEAGQLMIHVLDKNNPKKSRVEVRVPMRVVDALLSGDKDELNLVAALRALAANGDTELVSVKDEQNTVRVWLDSKNISE